jgi:hypothetical protein
MAKLASELPMTIVLPVVQLTAIFWIAGIGGPVEYAMFLGINLLNCFTMQVRIFFADTTIAILIPCQKCTEIIYIGHWQAQLSSINTVRIICCNVWLTVYLHYIITLALYYNRGCLILHST